jgi:hypothetical protein
VTGFLDQADAPATMVYYNESGGEFRDIFGVHDKRSENSSYFDINPPMKYQGQNAQIS